MNPGGVSYILCHLFHFLFCIYYTAIPLAIGMSIFVYFHILHITVVLFCSIKRRNEQLQRTAVMLECAICVIFNSV